MLSTCLTQVIPIILSKQELAIPIKQRAKFEGWFKLELAASLQTAGFKVTLEESYQVSERLHFADIAVAENHATSFIMLKTVNTNFRFAGVENRSRPITNNITGVIKDIHKLKGLPSNKIGYVLFPIFPVSAHSQVRDHQLKRHLARIQNEAVDLLFSNFVQRKSEYGIGYFLYRVREVFDPQIS
ncbi:hypothetical protein [Candidatus Leptofilum sp.]|uniref:hypothetical protein n=1 Tax=Candidatus Leptofilum sp. TaxID=3241576 RepID=UPI003B5CC33D